jgi:protocatechuate 3,4-dioxygenase beta subunit
MKSTLIALALVLFLAACAAPVATPMAETPAIAAEDTTAAMPTATSPGTTATPAAATDLFADSEITLGTPACSGTFTPEQTEGPYYTAGSPERKIIYESGMAGTRLIIVGYVLDADCQPISGAWLDFWQADASGNYDNQGYTLRGHQVTDEQGRYFLETVVPGEYPGRTQHIHVKLQEPGGQILTSQLYFPGSAGNSTDNIYTPATLVTIEDRGDYQVAYYDFVLNTK